MFDVPVLKEERLLIKKDLYQFELVIFLYQVTFLYLPIVDLCFCNFTRFSQLLKSENELLKCKLYNLFRDNLLPINGLEKNHVSNVPTITY